MTENYPCIDLELRLNELGISDSNLKTIVESLKRNNQFYQAIFDNMMHEIHIWELIFNDDGTIKTWKLINANPAALENWNKTLEEVIGKTTDELFSFQNSTDLFMPIVKKAINEGKPLAWNEYFPPTDQHLHMITIPFDKKTFISVGMDISELIGSKSFLQESLDIHKRTEAIAHVGSWDWNIHNDIVNWSEELFRIFKIDPSEGAPPFSEQSKLYVPEDFKKLLKAVELCVKNDTPYELELKAIRSDGEIRNCISRGHPQKDDSGRTIKLFGSFQDITELTRAKDELDYIINRDKALLDHSPVCHKIVDLDFNLQYMSGNGFKMLNLCPGDEVYGKPYPFSFFPESFKKNMIKNMKLVLETGNPIIDEDITNDCKGNNVWLESSIIPVFGKTGQIDYLTVVSANTTERKIHEQEKKRMEEKIQQSQRLDSIGTLAGGIAHDFNNMLGVISGNLSYALNSLNKSDELYDILSEIQESARHAQNLTKQLLTFSKGGAPVKKVSDINKIVENSSTFSIRGSKAKCIFELSDDLWSANVDEGQIVQVINNLIINANHSMPNGGEITIRTKNIRIRKNGGIPLTEGNYVHISVEDQGVGIPQKYIANIFEPYFTTKQKGSGLGLATAYSIIDNHDGYISVYSDMEKGTVFNIYLPASDEDVQKSVSRKKAEHSGNGRILVMDDQESFLKMLERILERMGYETALTVDGTEAIETYREAYDAGKPFDAVILDLTVPGGQGGANTIIELLKIDPDVKAIASSGYSNDPIMSNYKEYGFSGIAPKPYTMAQLAEVLNTLLDKNRQTL